MLGGGVVMVMVMVAVVVVVVMVMVMLMRLGAPSYWRPRGCAPAMLLGGWRARLVAARAVLVARDAVGAGKLAVALEVSTCRPE